MIGAGLSLAELAVRARRGTIPPNPPPPTMPVTPASFDGLAATRCRPLVTGYGGIADINSVTVHHAVGPIDRLKIAIGNFRLENNPAELGGAGTGTWRGSVEYPTGVRTPISFGGAPAITLPEGSIGFSDFTPTGLGIPDGAAFRIHQAVRWAGGSVLYNPWQNTALGDRFEIGNGLADRTMTGIASNDFPNSLPPLAIIAGGTAARSVCIIGDSKAFGLYDTPESQTEATPGLRGEIARAFRPGGAYPDGIPFLNIATGSSLARDWTAQAAARRLLYPYCSTFVVQLGFNDIMTFHRSADQLRADIQAVLDDVKALCPRTPRIFACTVTPKSSSTNQWIDVAGQSADGNDPQRQIHNARVRAGQLSPDIAGCFDIADAVEYQRQGVFRANGQAPDAGITHEGIHEAPAGYQLIEDARAVDLARLLAA